MCNLLVEALQFCQRDSALQSIHAPANANAGVIVAALLTMHPDFAHDFRQVIVTGEDGATIAIAAEWFAGKEAGATNGGQVAAPAPFIAGPKTLGGILDHGDVAMAGCDCVDLTHVSNLAIERDGHDGFGFFRDRCLNQGRVDVAGIGLDIDEYRYRADQCDGLCRCHECEWRGDDFVARFHAQRHQRDEQGFSARSNRYAVPGLCEGFQLLFKLPNLRPHDVLAMIKNGLDSGVDRFFQVGILCLQVVKFNLVGHCLVQVDLSIW